MNCMRKIKPIFYLLILLPAISILLIYLKLSPPLYQLKMQTTLNTNEIVNEKWFNPIISYLNKEKKIPFISKEILHNSVNIYLSSPDQQNLKEFADQLSSLDTVIYPQLIANISFCKNEEKDLNCYLSNQIRNEVQSYLLCAKFFQSHKFTYQITNVRPSIFSYMISLFMIYGAIYLIFIHEKE